MAKQKTAAVKVKKKIWVPIVAPKLFNERIIGETIVTDAAETIGKIVTANLMTITGDMKKQSMNVKLLITETKEGKAHSKLIRYEVSPPAIKRLVRRKKDRIDESLVYATKDGAKVRVKPFLLTRSLAKGKTLSEIRRRLKVFLYKAIGQMTYEEVFMSVIENRLQREMRETLSRVYPIKNVEIRVLHIEKNDAPITPPPVLKERPKEEEETSEASEEKPAAEKKAKASKKTKEAEADNPEQ